MWIDALLAYLHFISIFALVWFLSREWTLLKGGPASLDVERLAPMTASASPPRPS